MINGDCLEQMAQMDAGSVDAVVTDPPYNLVSASRGGSARQPGTGPFGRHREGNVGGFMGKHWDGTGVAFQPETWAEAIRVLKPSHYLLAFGGTRTWHRLACALEDAGFEIRDTLMWMYGSGFPKGRSCLKPAWEPIILARKPGPMRELGIEECRVGTAVDTTRHNNVMGYGGASAPFTAGDASSGRWPANVVMDEEAGALLDSTVGMLKSGKAPATGFVRNSDKHRNAYGAFEGNREEPTTLIGDSGGASRFFYVAKASRAERNKGCDDPGPQFKHGDTLRKIENGLTGRGNHHPTVKPVALMRWLVRLVARPGDTVLDPFAGSGTTGVACAEEGRDFIGIERESEYVEIAERRIAAAAAQDTLPV